MAITVGPFCRTANPLLAGAIVSCSAPSYSSGTVLAAPLEDWKAEDGQVYVDFTASSGGKQFVPTANCQVIG